MREAARMFKVSERTLWRWIREGRVPYERRKGRVLLDMVTTGHEVDRWKRRHLVRHVR